MKFRSIFNTHILILIFLMSLSCLSYRCVHAGTFVDIAGRPVSHKKLKRFIFSRLDGVSNNSCHILYTLLKSIGGAYIYIYRPIGGAVYKHVVRVNEHISSLDIVV